MPLCYGTVCWRERKGFHASVGLAGYCEVYSTCSDREERGFVPLLLKLKFDMNCHLLVHWFNQDLLGLLFCQDNLLVESTSSQQLIFQPAGFAGMIYWQKAGTLHDLFLFFFHYSQKCFWNGGLHLKYQLICKSCKIYTSRSKPSLFSDKWSFGENQLQCQETEFNHVFWKVKWKWKVILKFIPSRRMNVLCLELSWPHTSKYMYMYTPPLQKMPCSMYSVVTTWSSATQIYE